MKSTFWPRTGRILIQGLLLFCLRLAQNKTGFDPAAVLSQLFKHTPAAFWSRDCCCCACGWLKTEPALIPSPGSLSAAYRAWR